MKNKLPHDLMVQLGRDTEASVRQRVAYNKNADIETLEELADDESELVSVPALARLSDAHADESRGGRTGPSSWCSMNGNPQWAVHSRGEDRLAWASRVVLLPRPSRKAEKTKTYEEKEAANTIVVFPMSGIDLQTDAKQT
jgi:hypothetical protein